jgi:hypothetical protein
MWVTQTYLGDVERDAKLFVYYCYEDYNDEQKRLTEAIQRHLEDVGEVYGDRVSLMVPNPRFAGRIESEIREFRNLWMAIREYLPGLLLTPVPLIELREQHKGCQFVPLKNGTPKHLANVIRSVRDIADLAVESEKPETNERPSLRKRFVDSVELKPGIWGVRIDLKKLVQ